MLPKLKETLHFQRDLVKLKNQINEIQDQKIQDQAVILLSQIIEKTNLIDEGHNPHTNTNIDPRNLRENIKEILDIKTKLLKIIKDSK